MQSYPSNGAYPPPSIVNNQNPYNQHGHQQNRYPHPYPQFPAGPRHQNQQVSPTHCLCLKGVSWFRATSHACCASATVQQSAPFNFHQPQLGPSGGALQPTSTIRNAVNLKKDSIKLVPRDGDPNILEIQFKFDSSQPCSVTTFFLATEKPSKKCELLEMKQPPGKRIKYSKGLGLEFPPADILQGHALDMSLYSSGELEREAEDRWPVVIRLETVVESKANGLTLSDLTPGCPQPDWVQSQTTYGVLQKTIDGWIVKVKRQKIWVDGLSYELQEIYGMSSDNNTTSLADLDSGSECVICMANRRDTTVLPCRHMCMCSDCANELRHRSNRCPICRETVESLLQIKLQPKKPTNSSDSS
mmetsp:Transcript_6833/g.19270  ORF Transcript_6833/g.19270 Transcript_6833/m.19270 type:complete len:359 (+) Transcript_6833:168-1244(+)